MIAVSALTTAGAYLDAVTERMIPPTEDWPAAGALHVGDMVLPQLRELEWTLLQSALERLGTYEAFAADDGASQDASLRRLEAAEPALFDILQRVVYLGYYAHPAVLAELRRRGYDINDAPQPAGYRMLPLDPARVPAGGPGSWVATDEVHRVTSKGK